MLICWLMPMLLCYTGKNGHSGWKCYLFFFIIIFKFFLNKVPQLHSDILPNTAFLQECQIQLDVDYTDNSTATFTTELFPAVCGFKGTLTFVEDHYQMEITQSQGHRVIQGACPGSPKKPEGFLTSGCFLLLTRRHRLVRLRDSIWLGV